MKFITVAILGLSLSAVAATNYQYKDISPEAARQFPKEPTEKEIKKELKQTQESIQEQEEKLEMERAHARELEEKLEDVQARQ